MKKKTPKVKLPKSRLERMTNRARKEFPHLGKPQAEAIALSRIKIQQNSSGVRFEIERLKQNVQELQGLMLPLESKEEFRTEYDAQWDDDVEVIKNDKLDMPTFQEPEPSYVDLSMSKADFQLTVAYLIIVFLAGVFQGYIIAAGLS